MCLMMEDSGRLVNGHEVIPHQYPFTVSLNIFRPESNDSRLTFDKICGGILLSKAT